MAPSRKNGLARRREGADLRLSRRSFPGLRATRTTRFFGLTYGWAHLWMRTTRTEASACASVLILHTQPAHVKSVLLMAAIPWAEVMEYGDLGDAPEAEGATHKQVMR